jgi:hypothetical protein
MTTRFEVQGRDSRGEWSWYGVASTHEDALYDTRSAAETAVEILAETTGWDANELRIIEVETVE